jgi:sucrose synthase
VQELINQFIEKNRQPVDLLVQAFRRLDKHLLLRSDLSEAVEQCAASAEGAPLSGSSLHELLRSAEEAVLLEAQMYLAVRWTVARWSYFELRTDDLGFREVTVSHFLRAKERLVTPGPGIQPLLNVDLQPFERGFPRLREMRSIGQGVDFLNRYLSSRLFQEIDNGGQKLFQFLRLHQMGGQQLMLNGRVSNLDQLRDALRKADDYLSRRPHEEPWSEFAHVLVELGFEPGWGRTAGRARETIGFLMEILEAPAPETVARFLGRLPMVRTIAVISPHGYFGQSDVLGRPDTGGQVVYILDQVRALERTMYDFFQRQGLAIEPCILIVTRLIPEAEGTTCNMRIEPVHGTRCARILRVPFRDEQGEVVPHWISRFKIWPYLEQFAIDSAREIVAEAGQQPDFIIGNYSDGNLVASILSHILGVTQCNIAHALEKTKYLYSDLYWKDHERTHNFACQYTADLIAMNTADFIITSTYQEIAGTPDSIGQYESYQSYTMPGLYRVVYGVDVFDPKFNIVSPGADPDIFFPHTEHRRREDSIRDHVADLVHGSAREGTRGELRDKQKPLIFAMSRLDQIKNPAGLVEWFGRSEALRQQANLLIVGGWIDVERSDDDDERDQIRRMHALMDQYGLESEMRWVAMQTDKHVVGEFYRYVADAHGVFVQPALFEAFGLTVIEAMSCGLPTFATMYGGPLETIEHGVSGFHIDPNHGDQVAEELLDFFLRCRDEEGYWERLSHGAMQRIGARFTWQLYADRLMRLARIYGFWKYMSRIEREETRRYLEMLYFLAYRPMAEAVAQQEADPVETEAL